MGIAKTIILIFFQTLKYLMFFAALVYLFIWIAQIYTVGLFEKMDSIFGLLPDCIDKFIYVAVFINNKVITMGYVYCALLMIFLTAVMLWFTKIIFYKKTEAEEKKQANEISKKDFSLPIKEEKTNTDTIKNNNINKKIDYFCGLFELKLKNTDKNQTDNSILKLKKEYSRIIKRKLSEKYSSNLKFAVSDRVFFICDDFSLLNSIVIDTLKLYKIICNIDNQKLIKTDYLFSFYASLEQANIKQNLKILYKINEFKNLNRVVVNHDIFMRYWDLKNKIFDFKPLENVRLSDINFDNDEMEINLYYIKNLI